MPLSNLHALDQTYTEEFFRIHLFEKLLTMTLKILLKLYFTKITISAM